ncbi:MAG: Ig-like domain-containing protein [Marinifilaceae bacterium]
MKKFLKFVFMCAVISIGVSSCTESDDAAIVAPNKVVLNPSSIEMIIGDTRAIITKIEPVGANPLEATITWTSSNDKIVRVEEGMITAVAVGESIITATTTNGIKATCTVKVIIKPIPAVGITIENEDANIEVGKTLELDFNIIPIDSNVDNEITWESSDEDVATVADGIVTAVAKGKVTIKASIKNGAHAKVKITITPLPYVIASEMVGTWKCVKLQARYIKDGSMYEEDTMDKLFVIKDITKEEWCKKIKDGMKFVSAADNTIVWNVKLQGDKTKDLTGTITRDEETENQFYINYHTSDSGINFGERQAEYDHVKINWLPETSKAVYDEPSGSFYDFIYTCEIVPADGSKTVTKSMTLDQIRSFKQVK